MTKYQKCHCSVIKNYHMEQVEGNNIIIIIIFISSTSEEHTVFDKYISDTKHIIHIYTYVQH